VTDLTWQVVIGDEVATWAGAQGYCSSLSLGGYSTGWRLPSYIELISILDYGNANPSINTTAFPNTPSGWFWTATAVSFSPNSAWYIDFGAGGTYDNASPAAYVRCVHSSVPDGGVPANRYQETNGTVLDSVTGLTWQQAVPGNPCPTVGGGDCTEAGAKAYCAGLALGGIPGGWRLPTIKEIASIIDIERESPAVDGSVFPNTPATWFWTPTPDLGAQGQSWCADFNEGGLSYSSGPYGTGQYQAVRCVH
jgi:hypothetical protein